MISNAFIFLISLLFVNASVLDYLSKADFERYAPQLVKTLADIQPNDYISQLYGMKVFNTFDFELPLKLYWDTCAHIDENFSTKLSIEEIYYSISTWTVADCQRKLSNLKNSKNETPRVKGLKASLPTEEIVKHLNQILENEKSTVAEIRYALESYTLLKQTIPNPSKIALKLEKLLKSDDSLQSYAQVLHAASLLKTDGSFALKLVEDVVVQADEVDGKMLQWEGGLTLTSSLITGLMRLPGSKPFTQAHADKLATYLLSRKFVQSPKGIFVLVEAVKALSESNVSPLCITHVGSNQFTSGDSVLEITVSNLFGKPYKPAVPSVVAQSATRVTDDVVVLSKQPFTTTSSDPTKFKLSLKLEPGTYRISVSAGTHSASLTVHILGPVSVQYLEMGLSDSDAGTSANPRLNKLTYPNKFATVLQSDASQHLIVKFALTKTVHQAFLRLFSGSQEIIFVAEQDSNKVYKIDVHLGAELSASGIYDMELIIGDFSMSNKILWQFGSVDVNSATTKPIKTTVKGPKPEIKHMFRPAEKRPPNTVSMLFTGLALAPLLLLFVLWLSVGINFKNFTFSAMPFHLGLGSILGLFVVFWLKLNMFQTGALLIPLGAFTFLTGHKALKNLPKYKNA